MANKAKSEYVVLVRTSTGWARANAAGKPCGKNKAVTGTKTQLMERQFRVLPDSEVLAFNRNFIAVPADDDRKPDLAGLGS